jgi:hypothetical protein
MRHSRFCILVLALILAIEPALDSAGAESAPPRTRFFVELSAGPLFGIDRPLKGYALDTLFGLGFAPFEAGLGAAGAYDDAMKRGNLRFDLELGLGSGLRAIVGGLLLWGEAVLPGSGGGDARLAATAADWPNRFGIAATIAELPLHPFGARLGLDTQIIYTAYRVKAKNALSGAAAFAAGVEASLALRLRWETRSRQKDLHSSTEEGP